jgi:AraC family transcriptional regulator
MTGLAYGAGKRWREEYVARINRVIDYIESHLDERLSLERLAKVANFSPFHFHRIFGAMVGQTLNQFIARLRAEKAAMQLVSNPKKTSCG